MVGWDGGTADGALRGAFEREIRWELGAGRWELGPSAFPTSGKTGQMRGTHRVTTASGLFLSPVEEVRRNKTKGPAGEAEPFSFSTL
jgi:hypothetical protein